MNDERSEGSGLEMQPLTQELFGQGYFFCCDWDGMLIHKDDQEAKCCSCIATGSK